MKKRILIIYYSQTGQLKDILDSIFSTVNLQTVDIDYCPIEPVTPFQFPWTSDEFFNAFPETVTGNPTPIKEVTAQGNYDLIVLGWQPWYLSPSQPIAAFLQSASAQRLLTNQKVLLISGIRNMWVMAFQDLKKYLFALNVEIVGNIVLEDLNPNLPSVRTVVKWQLTGNKGPYRNLPAAGVSDAEIANAQRFGPTIEKALLANSYTNLQTELEAQGAVKENLPIMLVEKNGKKIFKLWATFILKKGDRHNKARMGRVRLFKNYLMLMIFVISPIPALLFKAYKKIFPQKAQAIIQSYTAFKKSAE